MRRLRDISYRRYKDENLWQKLPLFFSRPTFPIFFLFFLFSFWTNGQSVEINTSANTPTQNQTIIVEIVFDTPVNFFYEEDIMTVNGTFSNYTITTPEYPIIGSIPLGNIETSIVEIVGGSGLQKINQIPVAIDINSQNEILVLTFGNGVWRYDSNGQNPVQIIEPEEFESPFDLAINSEDQIYVADHEALIVKIFEKDGTYLRKIGSGELGSGADEFYGPTGIAFDKADNLYVTDAFTGDAEDFERYSVKIYKDGGYQRFLGGDNINFDNPVRIVIDDQNNMYVSDAAEGGRVIVFNENLKLVREITSADGQEISPGSLAVDDYGLLYISDFGPNVSITSFLNAKEDPVQLLDAFGDILGGVGKDYSVRVFDMEGVYRRKINTALPVDVALDQCGKLFVQNLLPGTKPAFPVPKYTFNSYIEIYNRLPTRFSGFFTFEEECVPAEISVPVEVGTDLNCTTIPSSGATYQNYWDQTPPEANCLPSPVVLEKNEEGKFLVPDFRDRFADNCDQEIKFIQDPPPGTVISEPAEVKVSAEDEAGNISAVCPIQLQLAQDGFVFSCKTTRLYLGADGIANVVPEELFDGDQGDERIQSLEASPKVFTCEDVGIQEVTLTVYLKDGTSENCKTTIEVLDSFDPVANCVSEITLEIPRGETRTLNPEDLDAESTDNCGIQSFGLSKSSFTAEDEGPNQITFTVTDIHNNSSTCSVDVEVVVIESFEITACPENPQLFASKTCEGQLPDFREQISTNRPSEKTEQYPPPGTLVAGDTEVTITATDAEGQKDTCSFTVQFIDNLPPQLDCPTEPINVEIEPGGGFEVPDYQGLLNARDNCSLTYEQIPAPGTVIYEDTEISILLKDSSNETPCSFMLNLTEEAALEFSTCPAERELVLSPSCSAELPDYRTEVATNREATLVQSPGPGTLISQETQVVIVATDGRGETATCTFKVSVKDQTPPIIDCPEDIVRSLPEGQTSVAVDFPEISAADSCSEAEITQTLGPPSGSLFAAGETLIEFTAVDDAGNHGICQFKVIVRDGSAPSVSCKKAVLHLGDDGQAVLSASSVYDGDASSPDIADLELDRSLFTCEDLGLQQVLLTVVFEDGKRSTCYAEVEVRDEIKPELSCIMGMAIRLDSNGQASINPQQIAQEVSDNCEVVELSLNKTSFSEADLGEQDLILTAMDASGNIQTCKTSINVLPYDEDAGEDFICPSPTTIALDEKGERRISVSYSGDAELDFDLSQDYFTCEDIGTQTITINYSGDFSGTCTTEVTIVDDLKPEIACRTELDLYLSSEGTAQISAEDLLISATDNCSVSSVSASRTSFGTGDVGMQEVTLTVEDPSGNFAQCTVNVTVHPYMVEPEEVVCVSSVNLPLNEEGKAVLDPRKLFRGGSGSLQYSVDKQEFGCEDLGEQKVTFSYEGPDQQGSCIISVIVTDPSGVCDLPVPEPEITFIILYPNPTSGIFSVKTSSDILLESLEVFDMRGRFLFRMKLSEPAADGSYSFDLRELQAGVYNLFFNSGEEEYLRRVIIYED